ncbi:MAG: response regulator [Bacteroidota bacterium]|nr:response regulator [Bacteroidota bacterium]
MYKQPKNNPFCILIADDDAEDIAFTKEAFKINKLFVQVSNVEDGQYLLEVLHHKKKFLHNKDLPQLNLLDLNMPRKNGMEVLKEIKEDDFLCKFRLSSLLRQTLQKILKMLTFWVLIAT